MKRYDDDDSIDYVYFLLIFYIFTIDLLSIICNLIKVPYLVEAAGPRDYAIKVLTTAFICLDDNGNRNKETNKKL